MVHIVNYMATSVVVDEHKYEKQVSYRWYDDSFRKICIICNLSGRYYL